VSDLFAPQALTALFQVITIDLVLAGDNAILIGLAATGLPAAQRSKGILIGIGAATLLRVVFAAVTTQLLQVVGLLLAGGFLRRQRHAPDGVRKIIGDIRAPRGSALTVSPRIR
jgi:predicted tellurium resistance membrane protein TerC